MAMLNNQTVCIMYMSIVSVTKKMQLSEILLEYVKTKCDDLNLFVGIAIVQICHFLVFKKKPTLSGPGATTVLCSGALPGVAVSLRARLHGHDVHDARALRRWFLWLPPVAAPLRRPGGLGQPGRTLKKCSIWWSFSCWLVVTGTMEFYDFPYIGNSHPNWLIFFRGVETTN